MGPSGGIEPPMYLVVLLVRTCFTGFDGPDLTKGLTRQNWRKIEESNPYRYQHLRVQTGLPTTERNLPNSY